MKRLPLILLCLFFLAAGFALSTITQNDQVTAALRDMAPFAVAILLAMLGAVLAAVWTAHKLLKGWVRRALKTRTDLSDTEIVTGLVNHFTTPAGIENPTPEDRRHAALVNLGLWMARREAVQFSFNATVTIVGGLVGTATIFLLYEQNLKLERQNERITLQTDANITESVLIEGARRASLSGDMANLFEAIRVEANSEPRAPNCKYPIIHQCWRHSITDETAEPSFVLSAALEARVVAFANRSTPYKLAVPKPDQIDFDTPLRYQFDFPQLSPERGQLLETLVRNRVEVFEIDFSYAQLTNSILRSGRLEAAILYKADLSRSVMNHTNLRYLRAISANFAGSFLNNADLFAGSFPYSDFTGAFLNAANLNETDLSKARFSQADVAGAQFIGANLSGADLSGAHISAADFESADMGNLTMIDTWAWADVPPINLPDEIKITLCPPPANLPWHADFTVFDRGGRPETCTSD